MSVRTGVLFWVINPILPQKACFCPYPMNQFIGYLIRIITLKSFEITSRGFSTQSGCCKQKAVFLPMNEVAQFLKAHMINPFT
jgi:hypothetical protein